MLNADATTFAQAGVAKNPSAIVNFGQADIDRSVQLVRDSLWLEHIQVRFHGSVKKRDQQGHLRAALRFAHHQYLAA